jgi:hypothetical protein
LDILTCDIAFEGHAHPHKKNILQYPGQNVMSISELPEVKSRISPQSIYVGTEMRP